MKKRWMKRRRRLFEILEVGNDLDYVSRGYDFINAFAIIFNMTVSALYTYVEIRERFGQLLLMIEGHHRIFLFCRLCNEIVDCKVFISGYDRVQGNCEIYDVTCGYRGFIVLFALLSALFLPCGDHCIPNDQNRTYFQVVQD